jgi:hypothetical protein
MIFGVLIVTNLSKHGLLKLLNFDELVTTGVCHLIVTLFQPVRAYRL